ncbi:tRNA (adenosine(37)-N6)-dimethylallyltransferase MiaA [Kangiella profundi]|uniref:tRNA dimethylallyltransferase n=1 Tax=Kangiella profundi TaxID=1561924 RepID=A0A2K9A2P5_9GAMM|nr:tRNA (adenosine(37)-N6)-dimethylallyltransferase MiaA [Kangiella profundi]AUD78135.1 tRNA (adenosine(37)-N6)-dimethylallyltransferase MiaA [Kangiella profundi]GGF05355.1 tRNA dimethylallyltransferase [Kangiella profundi]
MHRPEKTQAKPLAIFIMGPTASGKTELAIELVERLNAEIISVDSAMVYKGMDIGSAKPSAEELARAPHRLIDICDPADPYSAARFRDDALREMEDIVSQGKTPLLVGGTMLYYKALLEGMHNLPDSNPEVRANLQQRLESEGLTKLHQELARIDAESASRIHENDPQRTLRALEVYEITGKPLSQLHAEQEQNDFPYQTLQIALAPDDRSFLHQRIEMRFHQMMEQGFLQEVESLYARGDLYPELPSIKSVGYRQMWQHLEGELSLEEAIERGIIATRQLAKRQFTWLRSWKNLHWIESRQPIDSLYKETVQLLNSM